MSLGFAYLLAVQRANILCERDHYQVLKITIPKNNLKERKYILDVVCTEFLGTEYEIVENTKCQNWKIKLENDKKLIFKDHFFNILPKDLEYLKPENIPKKVEFFRNKFTNEKHIPIIYGGPRFEVSDSSITCEIDIFASSFFMITRWEECVNRNRDEHDRFPATESVAYKNGFLDRPIVNEYVQMLKKLLLHLDDSLAFKPQHPRTIISCDVDRPYESYVNSWKNTSRKIGGDVIKRKSASMALKTLINYTGTKTNNYSHDPLNTFNWIMDVNEQAGNRVAFYFLVENTVPEFDATYNIDEPRIRRLMRTIYDRGHEIGLHGSYDTYKNEIRLRRQFDKLKEVMEEEQIIQEEVGIRQHYLRWSTPETSPIINQAGLTYDTTLGYADHAGFRCGTCQEYSMFDLKERRQLKVKERPLIVMECSVLDKNYMNLDIDYASEYIHQLKKETRLVNGNFTLLWHNNYFWNKHYRELYTSLL